MIDPLAYHDTTLADTVRATGEPRIFTARIDGSPVYVAHDDDGNLGEVNP